MKKIITLIVLTLLLTNSLQSQTKPRYRNDIDSFLVHDQKAPPQKNAILLIGSSSFTKWKDVSEYFPGYSILNRGFGGSSLPDVIRYVDEILFPYQPKQVIIYCGENDIATDSVNAATVASRFEQLFKLIRAKLPQVPVGFISIKPSPSRWKHEPTILQANLLIKKFLSKQKHTDYIDIHNDMLLPNGAVNPGLFIQDNLHMNAFGYVIWSKKMLPVLLKD
jgi:lysophospholipase L1-like esterase